MTISPEHLSQIRQRAQLVSGFAEGTTLRVVLYDVPALVAAFLDADNQLFVQADRIRYLEAELAAYRKGNTALQAANMQLAERLTIANGKLAALTGHSVGWRTV